MKNLKISILYGGLSFVIVLAFGKNILVSLLCFAVLALFSFVMLALMDAKSRKNESVQLTADTAAQKEERLRKLVSDCRVELGKIEKLSSLLGDTGLKEQTGNVLRAANTIIERAKPSEISQTRTFYEYYIPETRKILENYIKLQPTDQSREASDELGEKLNRFLGIVNEGLQKSIENLTNNEIAMAKVDMDVMENTLKSEGLLGSRLKPVQTED